MRFRLGLVIGFGVGYVLGSKAGRQRYEQIRTAWGRISGSPAVQRATERTREMAGGQARRALYAVQSGVEKAGSAVKDRLGNHADPTEEIKGRLASDESSGAEPGTSPENPREAWSP
jgi:hypothetical protein